MLIRDKLPCLHLGKSDLASWNRFEWRNITKLSVEKMFAAVTQHFHYGCIDVANMSIRTVEQKDAILSRVKKPVVTKLGGMQLGVLLYKLFLRCSQCQMGLNPS